MRDGNPLPPTIHAHVTTVFELPMGDGNTSMSFCNDGTHMVFELPMMDGNPEHSMEQYEKSACF